MKPSSSGRESFKKAVPFFGAISLFTVPFLPDSDRRRSFPVFFGIPDGYLEKENGESNNALSGEPLGVRAELAAAEGYDSEHAEGRPACVWSWPRGDVREGTTRFSSFFCFL